MAGVEVGLGWLGYEPAGVVKIGVARVETKLGLVVAAVKWRWWLDFSVFG